VQASFQQPPRSGLLFDLNSGRVLWQLNPLERLHMASLTKMMTALRVVRTTPANAPVLITREAIDMPGSKVGLLPLGRHVSAETLLYGLLLPSGNDAAVALAQHASGSVSAFVQSMNAEAARLGLGCTHYTSPSGYYDARNYTCAADLAELAYVDIHQPRIAQVVRTAEAALPFPIKGGKLYLANNNPLLVYGYPGTTGMKTGYTELAGDCLVATAERDGVSLGVVLLHSPDMGQQAEYLLNAAFADVHHQRLIASPMVPPGR
jgi:D-alanyl-D-alanine carboxypeptidase (penicillin-binding protein 5/6)